MFCLADSDTGTLGVDDRTGLMNDITWLGHERIKVTAGPWLPNAPRRTDLPFKVTFERVTRILAALLSAQILLGGILFYLCVSALIGDHGYPNLAPWNFWWLSCAQVTLMLLPAWVYMLGREFGYLGLDPSLKPGRAVLRTITPVYSLMEATRLFRLSWPWVGHSLHSFVKAITPSWVILYGLWAGWILATLTKVSAAKALASSSFIVFLAHSFARFSGPDFLTEALWIGPINLAALALTLRIVLVSAHLKTQYAVHSI